MRTRIFAAWEDPDSSKKTLDLGQCDGENAARASFCLPFVETFLPSAPPEKSVRMTGGREKSRRNCFRYGSRSSSLQCMRTCAVPNQDGQLPPLLASLAAEGDVRHSNAVSAGFHERCKSSR